MGSAGQGSISFSQKQTGGGPPFAANAADNGLSVDPVTGKIVLGNNIGDNSANLLSNREIDQSTFYFELLNNGARVFSSDPTNQNFLMGDMDNTIDGTFWKLDGLNKAFSVSLNNDVFFDINQVMGSYRLGDINAANTGLLFTIIEGLGTFSFDNTASNAGISINGVAGFTGTVTPVNSITVNAGIVTAVT